MNIKLKAFLIALSIPLLLFLFMYVLIKHTIYFLVAALAALVFALYKLTLNILLEREKRK
jgi:hypothetical protein